ncbi:unnamed protein product [Thelazia callipaeda]|uniref:Protein Skeletor n=1 Tax=Thelazia callipaeda TaxID=103827 RepID=A0A0N5CXQ6_THECL|nr:unnamed protein product [Thelazia callipaeda]
MLRSSSHYIIYLSNIFVIFTYSKSLNDKPKFSPLTPYQTEDSIPPPAYGIFATQKNAKNLQDSLQFNKNTSLYAKNSLNMNTATLLPKQSRTFPESVIQQSRTFPESVTQQSRNWKLSPGAKLIGYNIQMIAGYIPTISFFDDKLNKDKKDKVEEDSSGFLISMENNPSGYNMANQTYLRSARNNSIAVQADWVDADDELIEKKSKLNTNVTLESEKFLEESQESNGTSTVDSFLDLDNILWPLSAAKLDEDTIEMMNSNMKAVTSSSIPSIKIDSNMTEDIKSNHENVKNQLENASNSSFMMSHHKIANGNTEKASEDVKIENSINPSNVIKKVGFEDLENINSLIKHTNESQKRNSDSEIPEVRGFLMPKTEVIFPPEPILAFQKMKNGDTQKEFNHTTLLSMNSQEIENSEKLSVSSVPVTLPIISGDIILAEVVQKNHSRTNHSRTKIPTTEETKQKLHDLLQSVHIYSINSTEVANLTLTTQPTLITNTIDSTTVLSVDSAEFADEDYDKAIQDLIISTNYSSTYIPSIMNLKNSEINTKIDKLNKFTEINDDDKRFDSNRDSNEVPKRKLSPKIEGSYEYEENENDKNDDDNDKFEDGIENGNDEDAVDDDENDATESLPHQYGKLDAPISFPEGIPSFQEWLSKLPIQVAFPFPAKNTVLKKDLQRNKPILFGKLSEGRKKEKNKSEIIISNQNNKQYSSKNLSKNKQMNNYANSVERELFLHNLKPKFTLSQNVPYSLEKNN